MILITGSNGFLGSRIVELCQNRELSLLDRGKENKHKAYRFQRAEINGHDDYSLALSGCSTVIHCAGRVHLMVDKSCEPLKLFREVNTKGTINLAKQAIEAGVKRFIFISSIKVNGEKTKYNHPFRMDDDHASVDNYGLSKSEAELELRQLSKLTEMDVVIIRPTLIYGPGVKANFASLMNLVSKGIPMPFGCITGNRRSLVSLDNLVDLIITCIDSEKAADQVFLVSDDHDISTSEMVREMAVALGKSEWQLPLPVWCYILAGKLFNKSDVIDRLTGSLQVDIKYTKKTLGWTPPQTLQEGFAKAAKAFLHTKNNGKK
ncbi:UDP-glucose 4-epimerase family protein [Vibrio hepatarius]|uniref:UDP-glucose 4-epimerase family protein n=1 Tax=Vibrio hepatarius TaxID=171383 RepID=UPI001C0955D1|nr:SDR family oxidoreductase [Vibrio hepatarius]MBU2896890.1 SDR family oxidoreductase [Vibrio hepatarius]